MKSGGPHLVNLNEDPMLDRKVVYDIKSDIPLTCGRRGKNCIHKLQLGGIGIQPDHCRFDTGPGGTNIVPLDQKAISHITVNGKKVPSMEGLALKPNDRICIGPSSIFLFKHRDKDAEASVPDTEDDPISFDYAAEEVAMADEVEQAAQES